MVTGANLVNISIAAYPLFDTLSIEMSENRFWTQVWTKDEEIKFVRQLSEANLLYYHYDWDTPIIQRLRGGGLVKELITNINGVLNNQNNKKIFVYSTHDNIIALLMHALNMYNNRPPPYGATLFFELHHQKKSSINENNYFVRAFYYNSTVIDRGTPHPLQWGNCNNQYDCPIDQFFKSTKNLIYEDFEKECNQL